MADFSDSFDCYATFADAYAGYWDSGAGTPTFVAGRFSGSQALHVTATSTLLTKSNGANDAVHHLVVAFRQTAAISGTTLGLYLQLLDGTTGQCCVVFRSDGAILLTSGTPAGTVLDTYTGAFPVTNTWYAFEIEVAINNTTGSWAVRKNGNTVNDRATGSLDTQNSANAYANKLTVGMQAAVNSHEIDDLYWRTSAATGSFLSDIRCYTRAPASDASVQFSRLPTNSQTPYANAFTNSFNTSTARYTGTITVPMDGTIGAIALSMQTGYTTNIKCAIWSSVAAAPSALLATATPLAALINGFNTFTFPTPLSVTKGQTIVVGFMVDTSGGTLNVAGAGTGLQGTDTYAAFPHALPTISSSNAPVCTIYYGTVANYSMVNEPQQDTTTSYVYDSVPGHADLYGIAAIASTPLTTYAVTTRAYAIKSDAGTRTMAVQLKSGATTDASPTVVLTPSNWQWAWKHYTSDPAGGAWTAAAVNTCTVGPIIVA